MYWKSGKVPCMIAIFLLPFIRVNAQNLSKTVHGTISLSATFTDISNVKNYFKRTYNW